MKRILLGCVLAAGLFGGVTIGAQQMKQGEIELQAADRTAQVVGDLKGAIRQYENLIAKYGKDRTLVATALLHMADAYRQIGDVESQRIYQRIVNEFADQTDTAAVAQRRVTAVSLTIRPIKWSMGWEASIAPDGRHLVSGWIDGDVVMLDAALTRDESREKRFLAKTGMLKDGRASMPVVSPDSRQVAFVWSLNSSPGRYQLRVMPNEAGGTSRAVLDNPEYSAIELYGWSADARTLLAILWKRDESVQLAWVSLVDGTVKSLRSLDGRYERGSRPRLSPDGRYIAYWAWERPVRPNSAAQSNAVPSVVYILAGDGSSETVVTRTGFNEVPFWTPDSAHLLFTSTRSGFTGLWSTTVRDGKPVGAPSLVKDDFGKVKVVGFTASGSLYYVHQVHAEGVNIMVADLDAAGHVRGTPKLEVEDSVRPVWSPDGRLIAFGRQRSDNSNSVALAIHSVESGEEKVVALPEGVAGQAAWLPDGRTLLQATARDGRLLFYRVDARTGEFKREDVTAIRNSSRPSALSPDGNIFYTTDAAADGGARQAMTAINLTTGVQTEIFSTPGSRGALPHVAVSPDGRLLALLVFSGSREHMQESVSVMSADGSNFHNVYSAKPGELHRPDAPSLPCVAWSNDGRSIFFSRNSAGGWELMRIPAAGGSPESTGLKGTQMNCFDVTRDGSRIAYGDGGDNAHWEGLVLDGLLTRLK